MRTHAYFHARSIQILFTLCLCLFIQCSCLGEPPVEVAASVETAPVPFPGDIADDACVWIHPDTPSLSTVIGTNKEGKQGGLHVYGLDGKEIQFISNGAINNVDIRYGIPLGGINVALVVAGNRVRNSIVVYAVNPTTRQLESVAARMIEVGIGIYGSCLYQSRQTGKVYAFVNAKNLGAVEQWELFDNGSGKIDAKKVRSFNVGSQVEGCVADDARGIFYIGEEAVGIWKYGAEPGDSNEGILVDDTSAQGHLTPDVEGLTIYCTSDGGGYLIASSQGSSAYVIYERGGENRHLGTFRIGEGSGIDRVTGTDGIDVTNCNLGPAFPNGMFVAQDDRNGGDNQNFKLVPWQAIATAFEPPLEIDPTYDPR